MMRLIVGPLVDVGTNNSTIYTHFRFVVGLTVEDFCNL